MKGVHVEALRDELLLHGSKQRLQPPAAIFYPPVS
jgi:hypothetical protein